MGNRLRTLFARFQSHILTTSLVVAVGLTLIGLARRDYLGWSVLAQNKDAIAALSALATVAIVLLGAIASYHRFFRGRTFSVKADLEIQADIIEAPNNAFLHAVTIVVKNVGSAPIWNPTPRLSFESWVADRRSSVEVSNWIEESASDAGFSLPVIEAGEKACFFTTQMISGDVWAVTYIVEISSDSRDKWTHSKTFANRVSLKSSGESISAATPAPDRLRLA